MKKKGLIIGIMAVIVVAIIVIICILKMNKNNINAVITIDIQESIELEIKDGTIVRASAMNEEANEIIRLLENKPYKEAFTIIVDNAKENINPNGNLTIILGMENNDKHLEDALREVCNEKEINANIIVPEITEEAKNEVPARGVTAAKAAYILSILKENGNVHFEELINKPASELNEMKETGKYCDGGYTLSGDFCEKVISEEKPTEGKTCPEEYEDINGNCYLKVSTKDEPYCKDGLKLENDKCVGTEKIDATGKCNTGTYNSKTGKCEVLTYVSAGTKKCNNSDDLLLDNGRCAYPHMGAHFDEPGAEIDPATECCCGDTYRNGFCYSIPDGNYDATLTCPSNSTLTTGDKGKACYRTETSAATYTCSKGTLEGSKCLVEASKNPEYKLSCNVGLELYQNRICIDYNKTADYVIGYVCENSAVLKNDKCLTYEIIEAKSK